MSIKSNQRNFSLIGPHYKRSEGLNPLNRSLRKINQTNNHYWLLIAAKQYYSKQKNMQGAISKFEEYLTHYPNHLQSLYSCAVCYMHIQEYEKAIEKMVEYLSLKKSHIKNGRKLIINSSLPSNSNAYLLLSIGYNKVDQNQKAMNAINEALHFDAQFEEGYCFRAKLFQKKGDSMKAFNDYKQAIRYNSKCIAAEVGLGDYYSNQDNSALALRSYEKAKQLILEKINQKCASSRVSNLEKDFQLNEIELKIAVCNFHLQKYQLSTEILHRLIHHKNCPNLSEAYYYLALNQLKQHENRTIGKGSQSLTLQAADHLGQAVLNLESSIKAETNKKMMMKACKMLIKIHLENFQFYQASNALALAQKYRLNIENYKNLCDACMYIIKQKYGQATPILKKLYSEIVLQTSATLSQKEKEKEKEEEKIEKSSVTHRLKISKGQLGQSNRLKTSFDLGSERCRFNYSKYKNDEVSSVNYEKELEWMRPIILLFQAYSEFFLDNFIECLQAYEIYESYIRDYLGQEAENDIHLSYNKLFCEAVLMMDNQMVEQSLDKFTQCIDNYYRLAQAIPVEPVLFKIIGLLRLALCDYSNKDSLSLRVTSRQSIMISITELIEHFMPAVSKNPLVHYYSGLVLMDLNKNKEASDALEKCLKLTDECSWKYLYAKGVSQMKNKRFKEAAREFSAGILIEQKSLLFLGRCLCYIYLFEDLNDDSHSSLIERSFEDLQKYIELEEDKDKISIWVTKILFFNKAYDEVTKSIKKVSNQSLESEEDILQISKCLSIYNGDFENGGVMGRILINAFEGKFKDNSIEVSGQRHELQFSEFISEDYKKWLHILNLYTNEKYIELIKFLQITIFDEKSSADTLELRYNLAIVYYLMGESVKADNIISVLGKLILENTSRIDNFLERSFTHDECIPDLQEQFKGIKRLSAYLPYRKAILPPKDLAGQKKEIFVKISLPFPPFPKPNLMLNISDDFLISETSQSCIPKKLEAPWIRKITGNIQFTQNIIESEEPSMYRNQILQKELNKSMSSNYLQEQAQQFAILSSIRS